MSTDRNVVPLTAIAVTPKACGGSLFVPKVEFNPIFEPGEGINPNAEYTQPIEISVPVAGVLSLQIGVGLGVGGGGLQSHRASLQLTFKLLNPQSSLIT
jgi:hypothetical protein